MMTFATMEAGRPRRFSRIERRQLTIETTLASLARNGAEGTSLRSVCRDMRVAPSLITHSFSGWHDILAASYELLAERFLARLTPLLTAGATDEPSRMRAIIRAYLATDWAGENTIGAMIAFWRLSRIVPELQAPLSRFLDERHRILRQAVTLLADDAGADIDIDEVTASFTLMMDGIWLHLSLDPHTTSAHHALNMSWGWLAERLGQPAWRHMRTCDDQEPALLH